MTTQTKAANLPQAFNPCVAINHAYRVVSGLNGEVPTGSTLLAAVDFNAFSFSVMDSTEGSAPAAERGQNPSNQEMALRVIQHLQADPEITANPIQAYHLATLQRLCVERRAIAHAHGVREWASSFEPPVT